MFHYITKFFRYSSEDQYTILQKCFIDDVSEEHKSLAMQLSDKASSVQSTLQELQKLKLPYIDISHLDQAVQSIYASIVDVLKAKKGSPEQKFQAALKAIEASKINGTQLAFKILANYCGACVCTSIWEGYVVFKHLIPAMHTPDASTELISFIPNFLAILSCVALPCCVGRIDTAEALQAMVVYCCDSEGLDTFLSKLNTLKHGITALQKVTDDLCEKMDVDLLAKDPVDPLEHIIEGMKISF